MRKIRKVMLLIIVFAIALIMKEKAVYAESTIQVIPITTNNPVWTNITVSDAYDVCQKLNKNYSTLGTTSLKAHLTTNADWYAVSLLTYSTYGDRNASNTTGNKTGIINFGSKYTFTSSLMEGATSNNARKSLHEAISSNSPYVESIKNEENRDSNVLGRGLRNSEFLSNGYGKNLYYGGSGGTGYPVSIRSNLFGITLGGYRTGGDSYAEATGDSRTSATFRPVIWNK